jgi:hypothetical protein
MASSATQPHVIVATASHVNNWLLELLLTDLLCPRCRFDAPECSPFGPAFGRRIGELIDHTVALIRLDLLCKDGRDGVIVMICGRWLGTVWQKVCQDDRHNHRHT